MPTGIKDLHSRITGRELLLAHGGVVFFRKKCHDIKLLINLQHLVFMVHVNINLWPCTKFEQNPKRIHKV